LGANVITPKMKDGEFEVGFQDKKTSWMGFESDAKQC
jgi:hypothetical protein